MAKKTKPPVADVNRKSAMERFRRLAGFLQANPGKAVKTDDLLNFIQTEGNGGNPADSITVDTTPTFS